jgi:hypothetical protein
MWGYLLGNPKSVLLKKLDLMFFRFVKELVP